jgi:hypothetical protein
MQRIAVKVGNYNTSNHYSSYRAWQDHRAPVLLRTAVASSDLLATTLDLLVPAYVNHPVAQSQLHCQNHAANWKEMTVKQNTRIVRTSLCNTAYSIKHCISLTLQRTRPNQRLNPDRRLCLLLLALGGHA